RVPLWRVATKFGITGAVLVRVTEAASEVWPHWSVTVAVTGARAEAVSHVLKFPLLSVVAVPLTAPENVTVRFMGNSSVTWPIRCTTRLLSQVYDSVSDGTALEKLTAAVFETRPWLSVPTAVIVRSPLA